MTRLDSPVRSQLVRACIALVAAAALVMIHSVVVALRAAPIPVLPQTSLASLDRITRASLPAPADIQGAVESDLFSPDRTAPSAPYRMPGDRDRNEAPAVEPMKPQVLGTAVATDGRSFASVQLGDASPVLVHVGDKIGEWTVKAIGRGKVTLVTAAGARADLSAPKPGT